MANSHVRRFVSSSTTKSSFSRRSLLTSIALGVSAAALVAGCSGSSSRVNAPVAVGSNEQALVERSSAVFAALRKDPRFSSMDEYLTRARGVLIFPKLVKASLIVGGEGGGGVLVARRADGSWSSPVFYTLRSPSVGLQIGYQEATAALFIMNDRTLARTLSTNVALGAKAGASVGDIDDHGKTSGSVLSADMVQVIDAEGAFVGVSLDGYVISPRPRQNQAFYGKALTPEQILTAPIKEPSALMLERALMPRDDLEKLSAR